MKVFGDYHTHTKASDGRGTVAKNAAQAMARGITTLGATDHGFTCIMLHQTKEKLKMQAEEIKKVNEAGGIKVLRGLETNIIGYDGVLDVDPEVIKHLDVLHFGFHRYLHPRGDGGYFEFNIKNGFFPLSVRRELEPKCTAAYLKVIETYPIDVICHPLSRTIIDVKRIAEAAAANGCYFELNEKHIHSLEDDIDLALKTKVNFIMGSDAHKPSDVGRFDRVIPFIERHRIPEERIAGVGLVPVFKNAKK
jgi:putative hydrolase